jgi:hypothetical protein
MNSKWDLPFIYMEMAMLSYLFKWILKCCKCECEQEKQVHSVKKFFLLYSEQFQTLKYQCKVNISHSLCIDTNNLFMRV